MHVPYGCLGLMALACQARPEPRPWHYLVEWTGAGQLLRATVAQGCVPPRSLSALPLRGVCRWIAITNGGALHCIIL